MSIQNIVIAGIVALVSSAQLLAGPGENPYVELYRNRVSIAQTAVDRQQAVIAYKEASLRRAERLYNDQIITREEYDQIFSEYEVSRLTKVNLEALVREASSLLLIAEVRTEAGQDMPICSPYDRPFY